MPDINGDHDATKHPNGETGDIDKTIKLSFLELAPGDAKKVSEHFNKLSLPNPQIHAIPPVGLEGEIKSVKAFDTGQFLFVNDTA